MNIDWNTAPLGATHASNHKDPLWYRVTSESSYDFWDERIPGWPLSFGKPLAFPLVARHLSESVNLTRDDYRDRCAMLQRDLKTAQSWTTGYRRLALLGWLAFLGAMLWQPSAHADTLPAGSLACVDAETWAQQQNQTMFEPAVPGCVYTYHDFEVSVEAPGVVWVELGDRKQQVWVFAAAVQP